MERYPIKIKYDTELKNDQEVLKGLKKLLTIHIGDTEITESK
jgi:hypothetical protein